MMSKPDMVALQWRQVGRTAARKAYVVAASYDEPVRRNMNVRLTGSLGTSSIPRTDHEVRLADVVGVQEVSTANPSPTLIVQLRKPSVPTWCVKDQECPVLNGPKYSYLECQEMPWLSPAFCHDPGLINELTERNREWQAYLREVAEGRLSSEFFALLGLPAEVLPEAQQMVLCFDKEGPLPGYRKIIGPDEYHQWFTCSYAPLDRDEALRFLAVYERDLASSKKAPARAA